jgi:hypothetical protein
MGGGGGLLGGVTGMLFGEPDIPATPDYTGAAKETAAGNLDAARAAVASNRVNQVTPYGSLNYAVTGKDPYGNPTWTATSTLSPDQQALYDYDIASSKGLGRLQEKGLNYVGQMIDQPFSTSSLPQLSSRLNAPQFNQLGNAETMQRAGSTEQLQRDIQDQGMAGWDRASALMMQRLQPQMDIQQKNLDARLANQGIAVGTEAYNRAKIGLGAQQNDLLTQAQLQSQGIGQNLFNQALQAGQFGNQAMTQQQQNQLANLGFSNAAAQQDFGNRQAQLQMNNAIQQQMFGNQAAQAQLANQARGQGFQELAYQRNEPINTLNAVRSGSQVTTPNQFYVNAPQQATTAGADYLGAAGMTGNANIAAANASNAQRNAMISGLFSIGSSAAGAK